MQCVPRQSLGTRILVGTAHPTILALVVACLGGCSSKPLPPPVAPAADSVSTFSFDDLTPASGIDAVYRNGRDAHKYAILESLGGGGALWDYDRDGRLDVFVPGGGEFAGERDIRGLPHRLFRAQPDLQWTDVTEAAGCGPSPVYTHGCAVADADDDGFPDLLVTGYGSLQFWRNQGDGTFTARDSTWRTTSTGRSTTTRCARARGRTAATCARRASSAASMTPSS
jgi:hypothetical protein